MPVLYRHFRAYVVFGDAIPGQRPGLLSCALTGLSIAAKYRIRERVLALRLGERDDEAFADLPKGGGALWLGDERLIVGLARWRD